MAMYPAPSMRVSDADREAVVAHLGAAAAEGRLTLEEFDERSRQAYASRTWGELTSLVQDLPVRPDAAAGPHVAPPTGTGSESVLPLLSLVFGVLSLPSPCVFVGGPVGAVAIVLAILALRSANRGITVNRRMAVVGLVCGSLGLVVEAVMIAFFALAE